MIDIDSAKLPPSFSTLGNDKRGFRLAESSPSGITSIKIEVDNHHPIEVDGIVVDKRLGSIGLIHLLPEPSRRKAGSLKEIDQQINHMIENAAYLRQLLSLRRSEQNDPMRSVLPSIEIVFLDPVGDQAQTVLANHLRQSLQESALLHNLSVGVALVDATVNSARDKQAQLRRAFCWLLADTERWFDGIAELHQISRAKDLLGIDHIEELSTTGHAGLEKEARRQRLRNSHPASRRARSPW